MKRLLHVIATPRGKESRTLKVSEAFLDGFRKNHPQCRIDELNTSTEKLPPLTIKRIDGKYALLGGKDLTGELKDAWRDRELYRKIPFGRRIPYKYADVEFWDSVFSQTLYRYNCPARIFILRGLKTVRHSFCGGRIGNGRLSIPPEGRRQGTSGFSPRGSISIYRERAGRPFSCLRLPRSIPQDYIWLYRPDRYHLRKCPAYRQKNLKRLLGLEEGVKVIGELRGGLQHITSIKSRHASELKI